MVVFGLWFYLSGAAVLIGAEGNAELLGAAYKKLPVKEVPKRASEAPNYLGRMIISHVKSILGPVVIWQI
jgi:hypothetical protein